MSLVKYRDNSGFSLVELVTVILLLGILGIVALGRFADQDSFAARGFFDDTVTAVRFAQKLAVSSGCEVQVITTASSYQVFQRATDCTTGAFTRAVANPADRSVNYQNKNMPAGFGLTAGTITFNSRGERNEATSVFSMTDGSVTYQFRVHQTTGLVRVL